MSRSGIVTPKFRQKSSKNNVLFHVVFFCLKHMNGLFIVHVYQTIQKIWPMPSSWTPRRTLRESSPAIAAS